MVKSIFTSVPWRDSAKWLIRYLASTFLWKGGRIVLHQWRSQCNFLCLLLLPSSPRVSQSKSLSFPSTVSSNECANGIWTCN